MEIILAEKMGFCFGVKRTVNETQKLVDQNLTNAITFGPIIHNNDVISYFNQKGITYVNNLEELKQKLIEKKIDTVVVRTHGIRKDTLEEIKKLNLKVINGTCPYVTKVHKIVEKMSKEGYPILIIGKADHPEIIGVTGYIENNVPYFIVKDEEDLNQIDFSKIKKIVVVSQTTEKIEKVQKIVSKLISFIPEVRYFKTICYATDENQEAVHKLAPEVDVMIVIGGKNSSNTKKLFEIAKKYCQRSYHIENEKELDINWFNYNDKVGISAGASTPDWVISNVINKIKEFSNILQNSIIKT
ncbi:MAG: 4-hydroxy-3-methylbut-2-enyl diphosphate reductase [bacterium]|mgnify:FL=1|nr:4-hydroxy-3-methylbut-2-enyl diphosphate reductase [bacterium]